jgi:hypothetical protein
MNRIITPDQIIDELVSIRQEAEKGISVQYQAELKMLQLELALDKAEAIAYLNADGTAGERNAKVKIMTENEALEYAVSKAEFKRVKIKMKHLELSQMSVQTQARLVELTYRSSMATSR